MKFLVQLMAAMLLIADTGAPGVVIESSQPDYAYASSLWYARPALNWNEALPLGNGRLGAMVFGGVANERLQLNEQTLWSGGPRDWNNPNAKKYLPLVRKAIVAKKYHEADSLAKFMQGPYTESYLPMADVSIRYNDIKDSSNYKRELNLDSAISKISFTSQGKSYTRTSFASFPDQAIVYRDTCSVKASVSFTVSLSSKLHFSVTQLSVNHLVLKGKCPKHVEPAYLWRIKDEQGIQYADSAGGEGMTFEVHLIVKHTNGIVSANGNSITVSNADAANFMICAATSYNGYDHSPGLAGKDPAVNAARDIEAVSKKSYSQLLQAHVEDYQPIFRRVFINLEKAFIQVCQQTNG